MLVFLRLPLSRVSGTLTPARSPTPSHAHPEIACSCLKKTLKNSACYASYIVLPKRGNLISITVIKYQVSYGSVQKKTRFIFYCQAVRTLREE